MKQTAVKFLQESLSIHFSFDEKMKFEGLFQQAKEMEKQQIIDARATAPIINTDSKIEYIEEAEYYYTKNYKK